MKPIRDDNFGANAWKDRRRPLSSRAVIMGLFVRPRIKKKPRLIRFFTCQRVYERKIRLLLAWYYIIMYNILENHLSLIVLFCFVVEKTMRNRVEWIFFDRFVFTIIPSAPEQTTRTEFRPQIKPLCVKQFKYV